MSRSWRLARSLTTLRDEVSRAAPRRSRISDGGIGDAAHASRPSRHNKNRHGVVTAYDITHDPAGGMDVHAFARRHVLDPHPELEYVISNGQIAKRRTGFRWETYTGKNKHISHAHFAVGVGPDSAPEPPYDSTIPWGVIPSPQEDDLTMNPDTRHGLVILTYLSILNRKPENLTVIAKGSEFIDKHGFTAYVMSVADSKEAKG